MRRRKSQKGAYRHRLWSYTLAAQEAEARRREAEPIIVGLSPPDSSRGGVPLTRTEAAATHATKAASPIHLSIHAHNPLTGRSGRSGA